MPDTKITALTALTAADPANDVLPIVDVSDTTMAASGTTKKISINNVLGASGTATLASATITGNLTVQTNKLFVNATGAAVGTTSIFSDFTVQRSTNARFEIDSSSTGISYQVVDNARTGYLQNVTIASQHLWYNGVTEAMRLNSTGLGVGVSPSYKLDINGVINTNSDIYALGGRLALYRSAGSSYIDWSSGQSLILRTVTSVGGAGPSTIATIDSSGNVGIGVTPSAWGSNWKANHVGTVGSFASSGAGSAPPTAMVIGAYNDNTNWKYQFSSTGAARYEMTGANAGSAHAWYTAPGGTVNNNITFTQAMTLAANGQLLLGTSTTDGAIDIGMVLNKPSATGFVGNVYQFNGASKAYTYISSAAGAFRVDTVTGYTINMVSDTNGVYLANGGTSWTALSDERFKDIIEPISNAVAKVGSIRSVIGKFKTESEGTRRSFLIAQDVQAVLPEAVDASNPEKLGVSYTEVIPLLVAAIKELTAEVNALKNA